MTRRSILATMLLLTSCGSPFVPDVHAICDGTGTTPQDSCTPEFLGDRFDGWSAYAMSSPDAEFVVFPTTGSYASTAPTSVQYGPPVGDRYALAEWREVGHQAVAATPIPKDSGATAGNGRRPIQSDLISALLRSAVLARESRRPVDLWVASDGRFISAGFNLESEVVPSVDELLRALARQHVTIDSTTFASFARVTFCGVNGDGMSASEHEALRSLLFDFVTTGGGPRPQVLSSCRNLPTWAPPTMVAAPFESTPLLTRSLP